MAPLARGTVLLQDHVEPVEQEKGTAGFGWRRNRAVASRLGERGCDTRTG